MTKYNKGHAAILTRLLELASEVNHIDLSIGYVVGGRQCHEGIVVHHAPHRVVKAIINDDAVWRCDLQPDGLHLEPHLEAARGEAPA